MVVQLDQQDLDQQHQPNNEPRNFTSLNMPLHSLFAENLISSQEFHEELIDTA